MFEFLAGILWSLAVAYLVTGVYANVAHTRAIKKLEEMAEAELEADAD